MRTYLLAAMLLLTAFIFSYCKSSNKAGKTKMAKAHYTNSIQTLIVANCSPCHIPAKGGTKKPLDTYETAKTNIDNIIKRIELNPTDRGFMPSRKPKLSDSTINAFKQWKAAGLKEN
ncbi:MAG: cytochrome c [Chitinophagaceae bacterium]